MRNLIPACFVIIHFCSGCVSDYQGVLEETEPIPVLNGVLYADSTFALNLTWSNHPQEKEFEPITGAEFILKKNGFLISSNYRFNSDGT